MKQYNARGRKYGKDAGVGMLLWEPRVPITCDAYADGNQQQSTVVGEWDWEHVARGSDTLFERPFHTKPHTGGPKGSLGRIKTA